VTEECGILKVFQLTLNGTKTYGTETVQVTQLRRTLVSSL